MWLKIALYSALLTPVLHVLVLVINGQDPITTPISQLSRFKLAELQTLGLVLFGTAHVALAIALSGLDRGRLWPIARGLLVASGAALFYVAYYFGAADDTMLAAPDANDPLWIVASLTGLAMGALQPGLARLSPNLGLFSVLCLGVWMLLVPLILLVNEQWLGAYERIVGIVYVIWMAGITLKLSSITRSSIGSNVQQQP